MGVVSPIYVFVLLLLMLFCFCLSLPSRGMYLPPPPIVSRMARAKVLPLQAVGI